MTIPHFSFSLTTTLEIHLKHDRLSIKTVFDSLNIALWKFGYEVRPTKTPRAGTFRPQRQRTPYQTKHFIFLPTLQ